MSPDGDQDPYQPGLDEQKVRVLSGSAGAKMAVEGAAHRGQGRPAGDGANDDATSPSTVTNTSTNTDHSRQQTSHEDYSGLQAVEPGLEVPHGRLPEAVPPSDPQTLYAEYKGWGHLGPAAGSHVQPLPEAVSPGGSGSDYLYGPVSQPYSIHSPAGYNGGHNPFEAEKQQRPPRGILGLRRMVFWCVLAVVVFVVVVGVAVGVGVGLGTGDNSPSTSTGTTSTTTATPSVPSATATAVATPSASILCPYANRTVYSLEPARDKGFLVLCGRDYNSCCGAIDMDVINSTTFEGCLEQCGAREGCTAVGWGNYYGVDTCWLKSAWGEPNWSGNWYAAVLVGPAG